MGATPQHKIARWVAAAGQTGKSQFVIDRIVVAGEFLERTARLSEHSACEMLTGIDFSKPVHVVRLPLGVYVQFGQHHRGLWFTRSGVTPDQVGLSGAGRVRRRFSPIGVVHALESTARAIKDTWTAARSLESISPVAGGRMGELTRGGATQYIVHDRLAMQELHGTS